MFESIKELPKENQAELYNAIFEYSLDFVEPELAGLSMTIWRLIKPVLEKGNTNYINGSRPKAKQIVSETEAKPKRSRSKRQAYKDKDKDVDIDNDIIVKAPSFKAMTNDDLINQIKPFIEKYGKDTCNAFYSYWSEPLSNGRMRLTEQKAWDTSRRLFTWKQREKQPESSYVKKVPVPFNRSSQGQTYVGDDVV
jgi:hypothetical protein